MLIKFKATSEEVLGVVAETFPYYEFYMNVMGVDVVGVSKILKISDVNPANYELINISSELVEKAKMLWPRRFEEKTYTELSANIV